MPYNEETDEMEMNELETKFDEAVNVAKPLINTKLAEAKAAIQAAIEISEMHGIPFSAYFVGASNTYVPKTFNKNFGGLEDLEYWDMDSGEGYPGWQTSYC